MWPEWRPGSRRQRSPFPWPKFNPPGFKWPIASQVFGAARDAARKTAARITSLRRIPSRATSAVEGVLTRMVPRFDMGSRLVYLRNRVAALSLLALFVHSIGGAIPQAIVSYKVERERLSNEHLRRQRSLD